jgi:hypothetical protein
MTQSDIVETPDGAPERPPYRNRICCSESFDVAQKVIRDIALEELGANETVIGLGGVIIGRDVCVTKPVILKAAVRHAFFRVSGRNVSAAWSAFEKQEPALKPVGDAHYHPEIASHGYHRGCGSPSPSFTDRGNSLRQAGLYFPFNMQTVEHTSELKADQIRDEDGGLVLSIDRMRSVRLSIAGIAKAGDVAKAVWSEKERLAYWASIIYPSDADSARLHASVIVHRLPVRRGQEIQVRIVDEVPVVHLSDEEMAELTGLPMVKIHSTIDPEEVRQEVQAKYRKVNHEYRHRHDGDADGDDGDRGHVVGWDNAGDYPLVVYGGGSEEDARRDPEEVVRILRQAAVLIENGRLFADGIWDRWQDAIREETIWDLAACIRWLRNRQTWRKS